MYDGPADDIPVSHPLLWRGFGHDPAEPLEGRGQLEHLFCILFWSWSEDHHFCRADGWVGPAENEIEHFLWFAGRLLERCFGRSSSSESLEQVHMANPGSGGE